MNNVEKINKICTGCSCCESICPQNAIKMTKDKNGFMYPKINKEKCINCGLCLKKCPLIKREELNKKETEQTYAFCTKNKDIWFKSTSGGAFTEICHAYTQIYNNVLIYGVAEINKQLKHIKCEYNKISNLRKSKYVQSYTKGLFNKIKKELEQKKNTIIFSGTPCQIAGLKNYLGKEYRNLICIDFVCNGVGSPQIFKNCIEKIENTYHKKIKNYEFRNKTKSFKPSKRYMVKYEFEDSTSIIPKKDLYMYLYLKSFILRPSCHNCKFRNESRLSDITIADLNNKSKILPKLYDPKNYSAIIIHTPKGFEMMEHLQKLGNLIEINKEDFKKYNSMYYQNPTQTIKKHYNFDNLDKLEKEMLAERKIDFISLVPYPIKYIINNIKNKF